MENQARRKTTHPRQRFLCRLLTLSFLAVAIQAYAQDSASRDREKLDEALNLSFAQGQDDAAHELFREAAVSGDPVARMYLDLGDHYRSGTQRGEPYSPAEGQVNEILALAEDGDPYAALLFSMLPLLTDAVIPVSSRTPQDWLLFSAEEGVGAAMLVLASSYNGGRQGFRKDKAKAVEWLQSASAEGHTVADGHLAEYSANNLKQLGLAMKLYANESSDGLFPPLSDIPGQLALRSDEIYPLFMYDRQVLVSPAHPNAVELLKRAKDSSVKEGVFTDDSYWYIGYALLDEETAMRFIDVYRSSVASGEPLATRLEANALQNSIHRLREGVARFLITDINSVQSHASLQASVPAMIERPGLQKGGSNVLYADGHVEFIEYPGKYPMTEKFIHALESLDEFREKL